METAYATAVAANYRTESRGAHARFDFLIVMMSNGYATRFTILSQKAWLSVT